MFISDIVRIVIEKGVFVSRSRAIMLIGAVVLIISLVALLSVRTTFSSRELAMDPSDFGRLVAAAQRQRAAGIIGAAVGGLILLFGVVGEIRPKD